MEKSQERIDLLNRIALFEKEGRFNEDVEYDDPPKQILPKDVDYTIKKLSNKFMTVLANMLGKMYFTHKIRKRTLIIKEVTGLENALSIKGGSFVTCNHFDISDSYVVYRTVKPALIKRHYLYKVIKEGNYNNFKGVVRILMRHANTLPLSSNFETMKLFYRGVGELLDRGEKILIYPEQAMWWNYKKPRPLKKGVFQLACKFNKPILPVFVTMKDSDVIDEGFPVQEYYVHYLPPIYPDEKLSPAENAAIMCEKNYKLWVDVYEKFYGKKLEY
ncbi:MAG: 1-acyl-sn-glycerol-3-phosphate acyltransferase [Clostridia bacterium]|nr:1-acyl-sn-glycerol-3-phosphate acyltransferase [Clostridia bacterium]